MPALHSIKSKLFEPIDSLSTSIFLRLFGLVVIFEALNYQNTHFIEDGILAPKFLFSFDLFGFIKPLPIGLMKLMLFCILASGILLVLKKYVKIALSLFVICFSYFFLLDKSYYNNHFYLFILLGLIFLFFNEKTEANGGKKVLPYWFLLLLQIQIVIVYFYGGLAKLSSDWLVQQQPLKILLEGSAQNALLPDLNSSKFALYLLTYGGVVFDLIIGFLLWAKKTRKLGMFLAIGFNLCNFIIFNFGDNGDIGGFPIFMIFTLILFIEPDKVRAKLATWINTSKKPIVQSSDSINFAKNKTIILSGLSIYLAFQLLFPLRHLLYSGNTSWTARGSKFAWRMKAHTKKPEIRFFVRSNPNDSLREVNVGNIINSMQRYYLGEDPVMIYQFAQFAGEELRNRGAKNPEVYAFAKVSLNGRPYYPVVDSTLNLLSVKHDFWKLDNWVLPLKE